MRQLNFSGNGIGNEGANSLALCVHNITELEIREGEITDIENLVDSILHHNHQVIFCVCLFALSENTNSVWV